MSKSSILGAVSGVAVSALAFAAGSLMVDPPRVPHLSAATETPTTAVPEATAPANAAATPSPAETQVVAAAPAPAPPATIATEPDKVAAPGGDVPEAPAITLPVTDAAPIKSGGIAAVAPATTAAEAAPTTMVSTPAEAPKTALAPVEPTPVAPADMAQVLTPVVDAKAKVDAVAAQPSAVAADRPLASVSGAGMDALPAAAATPAEVLPEVVVVPGTGVEPAPKTTEDAASDTSTAKAAPGDVAPADAQPSGVATLKIGSAAATGPLVLAPGAKPSASDLPKVVTLVPSGNGAAASDAPATEAAPATATDPVTDPVTDPGLPQSGLTREVPGVKVLRLGGGTAVAAPAAAKEVGAKAQAESGPMRRYAASFANPENKPLLGILIFDEGVGQGGMDSAALASIPFPVTIAVDPERENASSVAASYHAAGAEVAMLVGDLPDGSTPSDVEVAYQSFTAALPNSVALVGRPGSGMVKGGLAAEHVTALLAADGRGLITYDAGLNDGRRAAQKAGLPNAVIEKILGPSEDNDGTVARELDRAAFMANQQGASVVAITSTPEAITALVAWATGPGGASVALAPVSAVMMAKQK